MAEDVRTAGTEEAAEIAPAGEDAQGRRGLIAAGGILGALATSSCCILPLVLTLFGVGGAWMANLRALAPYQPLFIAMTVAFLGYGFYLVYWQPRKACVDDSCARATVPSAVVKSALWVATILVLLAVTFAYWFPLIVPYLP